MIVFFLVVAAFIAAGLLLVGVLSMASYLERIAKAVERQNAHYIEEPK